MKPNRRSILKLLSLLLYFQAAIVFLPAVCAQIFGEKECFAAFAYSAFILLAAALILTLIVRLIKKNKRGVSVHKEYMFFVIGWLLMIFLSVMPYVLYKPDYSAADGWFEAASAWTTTNAHVVDLIGMPRSFLLWKSIMNWLGGLFVILCSVSVFPMLGMVERNTMRDEIRDIEEDRPQTNLAHTIHITAAAYSILTVLELILLIPSGMGGFNALLNTFSSISTSGILVGSYSGLPAHINLYAKVILAVFTLLSSINFIIYYFIIARQWKYASRKHEVRFYLIAILIAGLFSGVLLRILGTEHNFFHALGNALLTTISFSSTSGYIFTDINLWPSACRLILLICMIIGGCSFSTSSGIRLSRVLIGLQLIKRGIYIRLHPRSVKAVIVRENTVSAKRASSVTVYILLYFMMLIVSMIVLGIENQDMETTICTAITSMTNNGTCFGKMISGDFSIYSAFGRVYSSLVMIFGRLEILPILILFSKSFWFSQKPQRITH
jgi:trk system potassium uptake protein TrkH